MKSNPVAGVTVSDLAEHHDERGRLMPLAPVGGLPFLLQRVFVVRDVPEGARRGQHAHRRVHQFLVCVQGECTVAVDDGSARVEILLDSPQRGIHIAPLVWAEQFRFSPDAVLLVLASGPYDPDEYVRDPHELRALRAL